MGAGAFYWRFKAHIPEAIYTEPKDDLEARLQDLDYLSKLPQVDHSFSSEEEQRFHAFVDELREQISSLNETEFSMQIARAAAISKNGHTNVHPYNLVGHMNSLPVRFFWFGDGLHIVRARAPHAELIGARVTSYDNQKPEALLAALAPYHSGTSDLLRFESPLFFASPEAMRAAGVEGALNQVELRVVLADGTTREVNLEVETEATPVTSSYEVALPLPSEQETESGHDWVFLDHQTVTQTHYAKNPESTHWFEPLPNGGMYMSLRNTWDAEPMKALFSDVTAKLTADPAEYLVIDLRLNWGGDYTKAMTFMRNVSEFVTEQGRVYILTSGGTFSAAIVTTAFAKHGAGERGVIVGTRVGDDDQFWAESGAAMQLPNSGIEVRVSTGYHDWENGCTDWSRCFWVNIIAGVAVGPLDPHIVAPLTYADYANGIDTTLQAVFEAEGINQ